MQPADQKPLLGIYTPSLFEAIPGFSCAFTDRLGGHSQGAFESLNLKYPVTAQDEPHGDENVWKNRHRVCQHLGLSTERLVACQQVHGKGVYTVHETDAGRGAKSHEDGIPETDGLLTTVRNIPLLIMVADCYPVVLVDPVQRVASAVHSGWRGTQQGIVLEALKTMIEQHHSRVNDVRCVIGTGISFHSFEVGSEVVDAFQGQVDLAHPDRVKAVEHKYRLNLPGILQDQLRSAGVTAAHIEILDGDTLTNENYFSYRRQNGMTGRQGVVIGWTA
jgi:polyphenol oxidase